MSASARRVPDRGDLLVVLVVAFPTLMDAAWNQPGTRQADALTAVTALAAVGSLLWRRRWPLAVTGLCAAMLTLWYAIEHEGELLNLPTMVALYSVAVQGDRRRSIVVGVLASLWSGALTELTAGSIGSPALDLLWPIVPLAWGEAVRAGNELADERAAGAERAAAERAEAERLRVAREVHDVVAHTLAGVNVQMEVAVEAFDARPDTARRALVQARTSSRAALQELRATVALLRDGAPDPATGLADVDALVTSARAAGVEVEATVSEGDGDDASALPPAVDLAAYRIVQEALTNVARHSGARRADVVIARSPAAVTIEVTNPADHAPPSAPTARPAGAGGGHGLIGMAERVAALGGTLTHGPTHDGGYLVRATLPLAEEHPGPPEPRPTDGDGGHGHATDGHPAGPSDGDGPETTEPAAPVGHRGAAT